MVQQRQKYMVKCEQQVLILLLNVAKEVERIYLDLSWSY